MAVIEAYWLLWLIGSVLSGIGALFCFLRFDAGPEWVFKLYLPLSIVCQALSVLSVISIVIKILKYCLH